LGHLADAKGVRTMTNWMTNAIRDGTPVRLYLTTSERNVAADLAAGPAGSLVLGARSEPGYSGKSPDTDERDLAVGAFSYYISRHGLRQTDSRISQVQHIPPDLQSHDFGGNPPFAIRLYEQVMI
jgi:hypothetical protein